MKYRVSLEKGTVLGIFPFREDNEVLQEMIAKFKKAKTFHIVDRYFNFLIWTDANGTMRLYAVNSPERTILKKINKQEYVNT